MRHQRPVGIKPHLARAEKQTRLANVKHRLLLLGADPALDPEELSFAGELLEQFFVVQIGENPGQFAGRAIRVDHLMRLCIKRMGRQVGRQNAPVPAGRATASRSVAAAAASFMR